MITKRENIVRDGKHCDLCGCTSPAVRCDKCSSQIFCLSCDDMYHRHPKRRLHLRKAVDSFNPNVPRPVTPNKPPPGDPSKMPIPPPRKKKPRNFFGTLMRGSPTNEGPVLPKKEFSWSDKFGSIKRFMSNRPLPPLPVESSPSPEPIFPVGTIYENVPDKSKNIQPLLQPRVPIARYQNANHSNGIYPANGETSYQSTEISSESEDKPLPPPKQFFQYLMPGGHEQWGANRPRGNSVGEPGKWGQNGPMLPMAFPVGNNHDMSQLGTMPGYATFRKPSPSPSPHRGLIRSRSPSPSSMKEHTSTMHQSSSLTDLHNLPTTPGPYPYYPHHPHQPYLFPMFPAHSYAHLNCTQCYPGPWPPSADNCEFCNSEDKDSHQKHTHPGGNRVKRSQSVMYDAMNNPVPYFPYPPGYGPFYPHGHNLETPPSPASSARSLHHTGRIQTRHTGDDNASMASSIHSRGKSTSSGQQKSIDNESMEISSEEEPERDKEDILQNLETMEIERQSTVSKPVVPTKPWSCEYCTYINSPGVRICGMCCKTISTMQTLSDKPDDQGKNSNSTELSTDGITENVSTINNDSAVRNNVSQLTAALEQAEKDINKELHELMKIKDKSEDQNEENVKILQKKNNETKYTDAAIGTDSPIIFSKSFEETEHKRIEENIKESYVTSTPLPSNIEQINFKHRKDSSCQTHEDIISAIDIDSMKSISMTNGHLETRTVSLGTSPPSSAEISSSPPLYNHQPLSDRSNLAGMRRSLSRLSLNYGRRNSDSRQQNYQNQDWAGYGYGEPLYRSISQSSLPGETDIWRNDIRGIRKPEYYLSVEELVERRRQEAMRAQGLEIVRMIREAEQKGFTADDLQVALNNCGKSNPVEWLENNWKNMVETVVTLATNYGHDKRENDIGIVSSNEAREALRIHKGNIWAAVTECVESRQRKYLELSARGNFTRKEVVAALTTNQGNVELAHTELTKATLKPFLMRIWGPGSGVENESGTLYNPMPEKKYSEPREHLKQEFYLGDDYHWNDERSDISFHDYDDQFDNKSNDEDYEYENSYDYASPTFEDDTSLFPKQNIDLNKSENTVHSEYSHESVLKKSNIETIVADRKEETKKKQSGFLSKLAALRKNKDSPKKNEKKISEKQIDEANKETNICTKVNKNITQNKSVNENKNQDILLEKISKENTVISNNSELNDKYPESNKLTKDNFNQKDTIKQNLEKKNSSLTNQNYFSPDKSTPTKVEEIPNILASSESDEYDDDDSELDDENNILTEFSLQENKLQSPILQNRKQNQQLEISPTNTMVNNSDKSESKSISSNLKTKIEKFTPSIVSNGSISKDQTQSPKAENVSTDNKTLSKTEDENKNFKNNATGAIPKSFSKKTENSAISKTISKFNFISEKQFSKTTDISKKQTELMNKPEENQIVTTKTDSTVNQETTKSSDTKNFKLANSKVNKFETKEVIAKVSDSKENEADTSMKDMLAVNKRSNSPLGNINTLKRETDDITDIKKDSPKSPRSWLTNLQKDDLSVKKRSWISSFQKPNEKQLAFERKVRRLLAEEKCATYEKAEIAVKLIEMNFNEDDVIQAMQGCTTLDQAFTYLHQDCELCVGIYPVSKMVSMIHCIHRACQQCLTTYFTIQIRDRNIRELMCPYCNEPDLDDEDIAMDYFNHLDIMLKKLVDPDIHELFQQKLRDRVLMKDPNFRWCSQCSSGFIANIDLKKVTCPDCKAVTCTDCRRLWEKQHDGISCEQFTAWKDANDPEAQAAGLAKHLTDNGIDCPNCKFRYSLAKGGCMHFRCNQCQYDFCSGCGKPFKMGQKCTVSDFCIKLGLHAHHPRNCLFYLRDKEPTDLQKLLEENNILYNKEPSEGTEVTAKCQVMEQKETPHGMKDDICGKDVEEGYAGLCRIHYVEYLGQLVNKNKIDPLPVFLEDDLELVLRRAQIHLPSKYNRESSQQYRDKLVKLIQEKVPLDKPEESLHT